MQHSLSLSQMMNGVGKVVDAPSCKGKKGGSVARMDVLALLFAFDTEGWLAELSQSKSGS